MMKQVGAGMVLEPREMTKGGIVTSYGLRNRTSDDLERLYVMGRLRGQGDRQQDADRRVDNGRQFQDLGSMFKAGAGRTDMKTKACVRWVEECHIGTEKDIAETVFYRTINKLGKFGKLVYGVCFSDGLIVTSYPALRRGLDALPDAMDASLETVRHLLKQEGRS